MLMDEINEVAQEEQKNKFSWGRAVTWTLVIAFLVIVGIQLQKAYQGSLMVGSKAPSFDFITFDGEEITAAEMQGKVVVINFWASWCKPCEQEAAELQTAWELYQDRGDVLFLGVDYVDTDAEAMEYMEKFSITYPSGPDLGTEVSQAYRISGVPETFIVGRDGNLAYVKIGPFMSLTEITDAIDRVLGQ